MLPANSLIDVRNAPGMHLRAAEKFVRLASLFQADIRVACEGHKANGKSILDLTTLAAECGCWLEIEADGPDAPAALDALVDLVSRGFGESLQTAL
jgi:phosphocarrier protein HPr